MVVVVTILMDLTPFFLIYLSLIWFNHVYLHISKHARQDKESEVHKNKAQGMWHIWLCRFRLKRAKRIPSMGGVRYIVTIIDNFSKRLCFYSLKGKDKTWEICKNSNRK